MDVKKGCFRAGGGKQNLMEQRETDFHNQADRCQSAQSDRKTGGENKW